MKTKFNTLSILLLFLVSLQMSAQDNTWHAFYSEEGNKRGFKNENDKVMIPPKFMGFTSAKKFRNIIAVMEEKNHTAYGYYLLKNGKKVGRDSLYIWDMAFDCESEGMIRFRDPKTDKVGFFDGYGKIAIPAMYSDALPFRNNVAVVIKNAQRTCLDGNTYQKESPCEHWTWKGGTTQLIDKKNEVLINDFKHNNALNLYSMKKNDTTALPYRLTQGGTKNNFYSFNNYKKQFEHWLFNVFIRRLEFISSSAAGSSLTKYDFINNAMPDISVWNHSEHGQKIVDKEPFLRANYKILLNRLILVKNKSTDSFISLSGLNSFIWEDSKYDKYFDDCGNPFINKYPLHTLIINHPDEDYQEQFEFLKTDEGYKLIGVNSPNIIIN